VNGDANSRLIVRGSGNLEWGNGTASSDVNLTRSGTGALTAQGIGSATATTLIVKGVSGQTSSTDLLQAQDSTGAVLAKIDGAGNLSVKAATITGVLTVNGHIVTGNTSGSTTAAAQAGAGTTASCTVTGNDTGGRISIASSGTGQAAGAQCIVTFSSAFGSQPNPVITPTSANATAINAYLSAATGTFTVNFNTAPTAGQTYTFNYFNAQ